MFSETDYGAINQEQKYLIKEKDKKYIFFFGADSGAAWVEGNIVIDNAVPYVICKNREINKTTWKDIIADAKNISLSTYYWIKGINSQNYEDYTYAYDGATQPKDEILTTLTRVFTFPITTTYSEAVMDMLCVNPENAQPYIVHTVANGHNGGVSFAAEPCFVSRCAKTTFEDIRELCEELELTKYINIDKNNWQQFVTL